MFPAVFAIFLHFSGDRACIKDYVFIDPPYNTGNDFVYEDDFADPMAKYKEITQQTTKSNPETMGRFHTNWLNMMYPRLRLASNLLRDDGVIFISIDETEMHNLKKICDEIFGEENFVAVLKMAFLFFKDVKPDIAIDDEDIISILREQSDDVWNRCIFYSNEKDIFEIHKVTS